MLLTSTAVHPRHLPDVTTEVITDVRALVGLQAEWNTLLGLSASRTPFLTSEWLHSWWAHLRGSATLNLIGVRSHGQLIGLAPLMLARRGLPFSSQLEFLGTGVAGSDYLDLIVHRGHEEDALEAIARALESQQLALHLDHLPPASLAERLRQRLAASGWSAIETSPDVCPIIDLTGHTWDSYLGTTGSSHRANVRRRLRALESEFTVRFELAASHDRRRTALEALMAFHDQRWNGESSAFSTPAARAFHHDITRRAFEAGSLRLYSLLLDDQPVAVMYGFVQDHRFYFYSHGYSDAHSKYSVGLVLMALTIRAAIEEEGATEFDMLYGHEAYKKLWARVERPLGRLQLFPPDMAGNLLRRQAETRRALRTVAHHLGLKRHHGIS